MRQALATSESIQASGPAASSRIRAQRALRLVPLGRATYFLDDMDIPRLPRFRPRPLPIAVSRFVLNMWQTSFVPTEQSGRRDSLPRGCVLRDYTIQGVLGHGGFGIVYKARHNELDHVVAIKEYLPSELAVREGSTIRAKSADCETYFAEGMRRFREEAKALIEFQQHPSILDCREFFRANGTAYLVMEHVDGLPLSELLRQREAVGRPFTESDLLAIAVPLAKGLVHIHRAGVIHRDVKPANILVRRSDQQPVLIDFGAAKQAVAEHSRSFAPYTEGYAALEQVADGQLGPWTDLYGFGAVLWRMVAGGNRPWEPPNPVKVESRANARVREADDPLPTAKELGAGRIAPQLLELIDGCLQLRDTERIRDSDHVVQLLRAVGGENRQPATTKPQAGGGSDVDQPESGRKETGRSRSSRGHWWKVAGVAAAAAVAVTIAAVALIPGNETSATPEKWSFRVEAQPATATVALLNGPEAYRPGISLVPGQYEVEVSAPGFVTRREWVAHLESKTLHRVDLEPIPDAEPVPLATPASADPGASKSPPVLDAEPMRSETPSDATAHAVVDPSGAEPEQAPNDASNAIKPVATDSLVASDDGIADAEEVSPSTCGAGIGGWANCLELGELYRKGDGVPKNSGLAAGFYKQACDGGVAKGCFSLGTLYTNGDGVPRDTARAAELYQRACYGGNVAGCVDVGRWYYLGEEVPRDVARAAGFYKRACDSGEKGSCRILGYLYEEGEGVPRDMARAAELFDRACNGGDATGCLELGYRFEEGDGVPGDHGRAAGFYERACDGGDMSGCLGLGFLYRDGKGVVRDATRAAELFERSCGSVDRSGCRFLGYLYEKGDGVRQDVARAVESFERACDGGDATGCWTLGYRYEKGEGVPEDYGLATGFYERACDEGESAGCVSLGFLQLSGKGVMRDVARSAELFARACNEVERKGCQFIGLLYENGEGVPQDYTRAAEFYERACDSGDLAGCTSLGALFARGEGVPLDRAHAARLHERACEGGHAGACNDLGLLYDSGHGVNQDHIHAAELYHRACEGRNTSGCFNLGNLYYEGKGVRQDQARAAELFRRACDSNNMGGCHNLALSYYLGHGVGKDRSVAASLFKNACDNGNQGACEKLESLDWR